MQRRRHDEFLGGCHAIVSASVGHAGAEKRMTDVDHPLKVFQWTSTLLKRQNDYCIVACGFGNPPPD